MDVVKLLYSAILPGNDRGMRLSREYQSPNFSSLQIPVEFLILHYTACDLKKTMEIFLDPKTQITAHFVIDGDGTIYDLADLYQGPMLRGAHAGKSNFQLEGKAFTSFNDFAIGIEIVNQNGNIYPYSDAQYEALRELITHLQQRFLALKDSKRIIGHEHIAHWRGKSDPGLQFDWQRLLTSLGLPILEQHRFHACQADDVDFLRARTAKAPGFSEDPEFWSNLSAELEKRIAARVTR